MVKKRGLTIVGIFIVIFAGLNIYLFYNRGGPSYSSMSGMFIKEVPSLPLHLDISTIAFILQWVVLLAIAFVAYAKFLKHKNEEKITINFNQLKIKKPKSGTDLDVLYNLLQEKKKIGVNTIAKLFKIPKEKALEWGKILENQELVIIEYPAFSDPEVKLNEKEKEGEEEGGEKEGEKGKDQESEEKKEKEISKEKDFEKNTTKTTSKTINKDATPKLKKSSKARTNPIKNKKSK